MSELAAFITARLDEDEAWARNPEFDWGDPERALADVEAKRRVVAAWVDALQAVAEAPRDAQAFCSAHARGLRFAVLLLALPYADHPDYRQEWKP